MTAASKPSLSAVQAIAEVMRRLPAIGKDDTAPGNMGGYKYRGIELITRHLQPLMAEYGLVVVPQVTSYEVVPAPGQKVPNSPTSPDGTSPWQDVYLTVRWLVYGPDGSHVEAVTQGIGRDHTDKGANKAQTQAFKYLLMALFCISDAKDDGDGHDLSGSRVEEPVDTASISAATALYGRLLRVRGTPIADAIKQWADNEGHGLTELQLRDPAWRHAVTTELDRLEQPADSLPLEVPT